MNTRKCVEKLTVVTKTTYNLEHYINMDNNNYKKASAEQRWIRIFQKYFDFYDFQSVLNPPHPFGKTVKVENNVRDLFVIKTSLIGIIILFC